MRVILARLIASTMLKPYQIEPQYTFSESQKACQCRCCAIVLTVLGSATRRRCVWITKYVYGLGAREGCEWFELTENIIITLHWYFILSSKGYTCIVYIAENTDEPNRELFVWSVFFNRISMAKFFWKRCPDQLGSALVASLMMKSMARDAYDPVKRHLAEQLDTDAWLVSVV